MAKEILVRSAVTTNGTHPLIIDGKPVYKETILSANAAKIIEKQNNSRPEHLKKIIIPLEENGITAAPAKPGPKPKVNQNEN